MSLVINMAKLKSSGTDLQILVNAETIQERTKYNNIHDPPITQVLRSLNSQ
ncbi:hypothetical protein Mapa_011644 [Marchantia paleacea]|nr:hypothetical protein Mapa_011644 [Marchantia paleacea]